MTPRSFLFNYLHFLIDRVHCEFLDVGVMVGVHNAEIVCDGIPDI